MKPLYHLLPNLLAEVGLKEEGAKADGEEEDGEEDLGCRPLSPVEAASAVGGDKENKETGPAPTKLKLSMPASSRYIGVAN